MLLEFRTTNYKSFRDELVFSMVPAPKQKDLDFSILHEKIGSKTYKGLCSAVIYGPNASGKTNIISAMDTFKSIILRGHIRNEGSRSTSSNVASDFLQLIPNINSTPLTPVSFSIKYIDSGLLLEYTLSFTIGRFMEKGSTNRKIVMEQLLINEKPVFTRNEKLVFEHLETIRDYLFEEFSDSQDSIVKLAKNNLQDQELFLMNGFKNLMSSKLASVVSSWFEEKFLIFCRSDMLQFTVDEGAGQLLLNQMISDAAGIFGVNANKLMYTSVKQDDTEPELHSYLKSEQGDRVMVPSEIFESHGTIRFTNIFPIIMAAFANGSTLVMDEFDASIHPMALMSLINLFHNDELNTKRAQLIFNTHNPIFLNRNLFRRDEIKFVEREDGTYNSSHYSLSDFGTSGERGVRNHHDYMKNYFVSQYGAIKDIDFTPLAEKLLKSRSEVHDS